MHVDMQQTGRMGLAELESLLAASDKVQFTGQSRREIYEWAKTVMEAQGYEGRSKKERGAIRAWLSKGSGLSLPQITRLIRQYRKSGQIQDRSGQRRRFAKKYSDSDLRLLVEVDRAHGRLSGPATRHVLKREHTHFANPAFANLAGISVSHLYNLRRSAAYRQQAADFTTTRPTGISIGERRRPDPQGRPGYIRVDTVHQGDWEGEKGVYHINAVDAVTQWEVLGCTQRISEQLLLPVFEAMLHQFPFLILGVHADNGSEFINHTVARLLEKLRVEFTKSRPNRSSDNALVEGKNGAVVRKHMGYGHIPGPHAERLQKFYMAQLNPYLNYHRPCGFATVSRDERGRQKRIYRADDYATAYEKLKSLPQAAQYLKPGLSFETLDRQANAMSDTEAARRMNRRLNELLRLCKIESPIPPRFQP